MESPLSGVALSSKLLPGPRHAHVSVCQANSIAHVVVLVCFGACFNTQERHFSLARIELCACTVFKLFWRQISIKLQNASRCFKRELFHITNISSDL